VQAILAMMKVEEADKHIRIATYAPEVVKRQPKVGRAIYFASDSPQTCPQMLFTVVCFASSFFNTPPGTPAPLEQAANHCSDGSAAASSVLISCVAHPLSTQPCALYVARHAIYCLVLALTARRF